MKKDRAAKRGMAGILTGFLMAAMLAAGFSRPAEAAYVNTNFNTFIHDPADTQVGYPGQDMQIRVRIGYNGVNGLNNPPSEEIRNVRVRLSNDQSYLSANNGPSPYKKDNPYAEESEESGEADAWEEGYQAGRSNAYRNKLSYSYPVDAGVYPFEVNASLFTQEQSVAVLKRGEYTELVFNVTVRSDALKMKDGAGNVSDGYFGIPFSIWYDVPTEGGGTQAGMLQNEFINVYITETGEIKSPATKTVDQAFVIGEQQSTPSGKYPNVMNFGVNLRNQSGRALYNVKVHMNTTLSEKEGVQLTESVKASASKDFPFNINEANYDREFSRVEPDASITPSYSMAIKSNAAPGYYPLQYTVSYKPAPGANVSITEEYSFFVKIGNDRMVADDSNLGEFNENARTKARLIVDSYHTVPEKVFAGEPFTLVLTMKNASSGINASNILFSLDSEKASDSAVFAMEGGANSIVVNSLPAGQSTELRVRMTAMAGVDPRSYTITIQEKYDSPEYKNASEKVEVAIPVNQTARLSCSNFEVTPESVEVGNDANVMFGINNTGKVILYNVEAVFEADAVKKTSSYIGNIKPGETGSVDVMLSVVAPGNEEGTIPVLIRYEDVNGNQFTEEISISMNITEPSMAEFEMDTETMGEEHGMRDQAANVIFNNRTAAVIGAISLALLYLAYRISKKNKKKQESHEDESI